jgi:hypothetical protein
VLANPLKLVDPDGRQVSTIGGFTEGVITLRAILGDPASQQGVRTAWAIRLGGTLALVAAPVLATVALQHPATTAVALKEATDFAFGLLTDAPDPEGVGGGTLGQAAGRLGDDAVRIAAKEGLATLGRAGAGKGVREVIGDANDARTLFDQLRGSNPITEVKPGIFIASGINGGTITFRTTSKSGPPTVDVHGIKEGVRKIKFVDE